MPQAGEIGAKGRAAEIIERNRKRPPCRSRHDRFELRQHALAIGLSERDKARARRYPVGDDRVEKGVSRRRERNMMRGTDKADRNRIDDASFASCDRPIQRSGVPCGARDLDECPALRRRLEMAFARRHESRGELGDFREPRIIAGRRGPVRMRQKDTIANSGTVHQHRRQPMLQRCGIADVAGFHRPFDATGIGERTDRERRREPGQQPV